MMRHKKGVIRMMIDSELLRKRLKDKSLIEWMDESDDLDSYKQGYLSGLIKASVVLSEFEYFTEHGKDRELIDFEFSSESIGALTALTGAVGDKIKEMELSSHSETDIVNGCIHLMGTVFHRMIEHLDFMGVEHEEDEKPTLRYTYFAIIQNLLLHSTRHSGGTSTVAKCKQLGFDPYEEIVFEQKKEDQ